ncbi:FAD-dependent oxidoreductase [Streptomyces halobius]|uniref:FAD-dependent oxidoreductase n=1 Tax=Streptomyces halobius TaxID=2879846 RepID=A0ABY4M6U5_9ACTN|nr:FAD-dependent oxidoreductase [Streptomyces halobius]UQA91961.1 FAD-dependent oxidoreductase [Streptomyces halobius]
MSAYDLVVIGGGSAGLTAARTAGRFGARSLLVERDLRLGWTASHYAKTVHPYPTYADGPWHAALSDVYARLFENQRATGALLGLRRKVVR